jgi:hypothetical protein
MKVKEVLPNMLNSVKIVVNVVTRDVGIGRSDRRRDEVSPIV